MSRPSSRACRRISFSNCELQAPRRDSREGPAVTRRARLAAGRSRELESWRHWSWDSVHASARCLKFLNNTASLQLFLKPRVHAVIDALPSPPPAGSNSKHLQAAGAFHDFEASLRCLHLPAPCKATALRKTTASTPATRSTSASPEPHRERGAACGRHLLVAGLHESGADQIDSLCGASRARASESCEARHGQLSSIIADGETKLTSDTRALIAVVLVLVVFKDYDEDDHDDRTNLSRRRSLPRWRPSQTLRPSKLSQQTFHSPVLRIKRVVERPQLPRKLEETSSSSNPVPTMPRICSSQRRRGREAAMKPTLAIASLESWPSRGLLGVAAGSERVEG